MPKMRNIFQKKFNLDAHAIQIMDVIRNRGPIPRAKIAEVTGYSIPAVSLAVKELLQKGLLREDGFEMSTGGRKPILLEVSSDAFFMVGVDIGATKLRVVVTDPQARIMGSSIQPSHSEEGPESTLRGAAHAIRELVRSSDISWEQIQGIGVGISGIVDHQKGVCLLWPDVEGWENVPVKEFFQDEFNIPVSVDDSARTMALAEHWCGAAQNVEDFIFINVGVGVGAAIFFHGQLYRGTSGTAGELGHTTVEEEGPLCRCGNHGCVETLVSGPAIVRRTREALQGGVISLIDKLVEGDHSRITPEIVAKAARREDKLAFNLMEKTGEYLGTAIANALNFFNPELVVIGAGVSRVGDLLLDPVRRTVRARALEYAYQRAKIVISSLEDNSGAQGGAVLVLNEMFEVSSRN